MTAADYDQDGRTDLYVGGSSIPGKWPNWTWSKLLRNTTEGFEPHHDKTDDPTPLEGRVMAARWADVDADGDLDLVTATDWGAIKVALNREGKLTDASEKLGLAAHSGWWRAIEVADVNGDGRLDIIAGNVGLNTKYRASPKHPAVVFAGDLDGSGIFEILEAQYDKDGRLYPLRGRSKLSYSFRKLRRQFRSFASFAEASVDEIFEGELLDKAMKLEATELRSGIFLQQPDGTFVFDPLPIAAQMAPIHGIVFADLTGDDLPDLFVAGNDFSPEPSTGRFDGSLGRLFQGDGRGNFTAISPAKSGLIVPGDTRAVIMLPPLKPGGAPRIVTANALGPVRLFEPRDQ